MGPSTGPSLSFRWGACRVVLPAVRSNAQHQTRRDLIDRPPHGSNPQHQTGRNLTCGEKENPTSAKRYPGPSKPTMCFAHVTTLRQLSIPTPMQGSFHEDPASLRRARPCAEPRTTLDEENDGNPMMPSPPRQREATPYFILLMATHSPSTQAPLTLTHNTHREVRGARFFLSTVAG